MHKKPYLVPNIHALSDYYTIVTLVIKHYDNDDDLAGARDT